MDRDVKRRREIGLHSRAILDKLYRDLLFRTHHVAVHQCLQHFRRAEVAENPELRAETNENVLICDGRMKKDVRTAVVAETDAAVAAVTTVTVAEAKIRGPSAEREDVDMASTTCIIIIMKEVVVETMTVAILGAIDCLQERPIRTLVVPTAHQIIISTLYWTRVIPAAC